MFTVTAGAAVLFLQLAGERAAGVLHRRRGGSVAHEVAVAVDAGVADRDCSTTHRPGAPVKAPVPPRSWLT